MRPLIISRKTHRGFGGLNRFYTQLAGEFGVVAYTLSPDSLAALLRLPFEKPTHIFLCDATLLPLGFFLKKVLKKPLIVTTHGLDITFTNPLYQHMLQRFLPKADAIILDSKSAEKLLKKFPIHSPISVIPLGIDILHLKESKPFAVPRITDKIVLTTVGNLVKRKGHTWFIKHVLAHLPERFVYCIVGKGAQEQVIRQEIQRLHLAKRVLLLGQLEDSKLSFLLKNTDIYVSPNQHIEGNFESFGIAIGEAAALGIPVVASDIDGISEIIKNGKNGFLVKPTADEFISTLLRLEDSRIRRRLGKRAQTYTIKNFSWEKTTKSYIKIFAQFDKN